MFAFFLIWAISDTCVGINLLRNKRLKVYQMLSKEKKPLKF